MHTCGRSILAKFRSPEAAYWTVIICLPLPSTERLGCRQLGQHIILLFDHLMQACLHFLHSNAGNNHQVGIFGAIHFGVYGSLIAMEVERRGEKEVPGQFVVLDHYLCTYMYLSFEHQASFCLLACLLQLLWLAFWVRSVAI